MYDDDDELIPSGDTRMQREVSTRLRLMQMSGIMSNGIEASEEIESIEEDSSSREGGTVDNTTDFRECVTAPSG